ncbi:MAG: hypothetical protein KDA32_06485 [Phycisphaerales bacterium]|nr:hypothetical protein [Phycisphaerales bacterium]
MRYSIVIAAALCVMLMGADCLPLFQLNNQNGLDPVNPGPTLGVAIRAPARSRVVPTGSKISIEWTVGNAAGGDTIVDVIVRSREDFSETIIEGGVRVEKAGQIQTTIWDTTDFPRGQYGIRVRAKAGDEEDEVDAAGEITLDEAPSFVFTEPFEDTELMDLDPNDDNPDAREIVIRYSAGDPEGAATAQIGIDPGPTHTTGNEIVITEVDLAVDETLESFTWDGTDQSGQNVAAGEYFLYALVDDGVNEPQIIDGLAKIIVPEIPKEPNAPGENALPDPNRDMEVLDPGDKIRISFTLNQSEDVLVDLAVDQDDNHTNANEIRILRERLIDPNTTKDVFDWNGDDADGVRVPDGIYQIIMFINTGAGSPTTIENDFQMFVRSVEDQALIGLLQPVTDQERQPGAFLLIQWRDDDPSEEAKIRLTIDDDDMPNEAVETDDPEREILADREADGDGVLDSFQFQVPDDLTPGRYFIFAYIDSDGVDPPDMISTAAGQLDIPDPNQ